MNDKMIQLLIILGIGALMWIYLRHGGSEEAEKETQRMNRQLNYWHYKCSLWRNTEKIKRSYRYLNCKHCGQKFRIMKKEKTPVCPYCKAPVHRKKGNMQ